MPTPNREFPLDPETWESILAGTKNLNELSGQQRDTILDTVSEGHIRELAKRQALARLTQPPEETKAGTKGSVLLDEAQDASLRPMAYLEEVGTIKDDTARLQRAVEELVVRHEAILARLEEAQQTLSEKESLLSHYAQAHDVNAASITELNKWVAELHEQKKVLWNDINRYQAEKEELNNTLESYKQYIQGLEDSQAGERAEALQTIDDLEKRLEEETNRISVAQDEIAELSSQLALTQEQAQFYEQSYTDIASAYDEAYQANEGIRQAHAELEERSEEFKTRAQQLALENLLKELPQKQRKLKEFGGFFGGIRGRLNKEAKEKAEKEYALLLEQIEKLRAVLIEKRVTTALEEQKAQASVILEQKANKKIGIGGELYEKIYQGIYKKAGWKGRLAFSAGTFAGAVALGGFAEMVGDVETGTLVEESLKNVRRGVLGTLAGMSMYDMLSGLTRWAMRANWGFGKLRELKKEKVEKMKIEDVLMYYTAHQAETLFAKKKLEDLEENATYELLEERVGAWLHERSLASPSERKEKTPTVNLIEDKTNALLGAKLAVVNDLLEKRVGNREKDQRALKALAITVGTVLGTGVLFRGAQLAHSLGDALHEILTGGELGKAEALAQAAKTGAEQIIPGMHEKLGKETIEAIREAAAKKAQEVAAQENLGAEKVMDVIGKTGGAAGDAAQKAWDETINNQGTLKAALEAAQKAGEDATANTFKDVTGFDINAAIPNVATNINPDVAAAAAFNALAPQEQLKTIHKLIFDIAQHSEASQKALEDIAKERLANKEFKTLASALADTKSDYYNRIVGEYAPKLSTLASQIETSKKLSLAELEQLRNIASWHDTPAGQAATRLLQYIENPHNEILTTSEIGEVDIDGTLYDAYQKADHMGLGQEFLDKMHDMGVKKGIGLEQMKHMDYKGTLWFSHDDLIIGQEDELIKNIDIDDGPDDAAQEKPEEQKGEEKPAEKKEKPRLKQSDTVVQKPAAQAAARAVAQGAAAPPLEKVNLQTFVERGMHFTNAELIKEISELRSFGQVSKQIISDCHARPEGFAQLLVEKLGGIYPADELTSELITKAARDPENFKQNIRALLGAFFAEKKPVIDLTIGKESAIISPRK